MITDFQIDNHGSICLLHPNSKAAKAWISEHLPEDVMTWGNGVVVEPRYMSDIVDGIHADGLTVSV